jgi:flagellar hook-basal body complex protein FliE
MPGAITPIQPVSISNPISPSRSVSGSGSSDFGSFLTKAIQEVEGSRNVAHQKVERLLRGESEELHSVALATQRAEMEFELMLQVRNKVVQAYQEVMRMQV